MQHVNRQRDESLICILFSVYEFPINIALKLNVPTLYMNYLQELSRIDTLHEGTERFHMYLFRTPQTY